MSRRSSESDGSDIEIVEMDGSRGSDTGVSGADFRKAQCPICLEVPDIVAVAECGHIYCHECVLTALSAGRHANRVQGECSICRSRVRYVNTIYLEFKKDKAPKKVPEKAASPQKKDTKRKREEYDEEIDRALEEVL